MYGRRFKIGLELKRKSFELSRYQTGQIVFIKMLLLNRDFQEALDVCDALRGSEIENPRIIEASLAEVYYYAGELIFSPALCSKDEAYLFEIYQVRQKF